ncbi:MAG: ABC transporter substrate-binding protein [Acidimicrobiales bacterium]|nr:ABC transporter substrate-binding protein [Acidimicrobiales bacterium]
MSRKLVLRIFAAFLAMGLIASACGGRDDNATDTATTTTTTTTAAPDDSPDPDEPADPDDPAEPDEPAEPDPCADVTLEATEIGVSEDTIKVIVMADSENALAAGLFEGARVGAFAWAEDVNSRGGIGCRTVEIEFWDSMLNPTETENGFLRACSEALALVGTTVLFGTSTDDLETCDDANGDPTGVPDLAYITTEVPHQCSSVSFHLSRPGAECPYESGDRNHTAVNGQVSWLAEHVGEDLHGLFLVPGDLPSTTASAVPQLAAHAEAGIVYEKAYGISGAAPQASFTPYVQAIRENGSNFVYNGSNDATMAKLMNEANDQGLDMSSVNWLCTLSCYTPAFLENGDVVEGTYLWTFFLPFEEADTNEELARFLDAVGDDFPEAWAAGAWAAGILFEQAINGIVETDGPNAITRARLLEELRSIDSFDVNGWWGTADFASSNTISECFMVMQIQDGEYVRVHPEERGTLDCDSSNVTAVTVDAGTFTPDS